MELSQQFQPLITESESESNTFYVIISLDNLRLVISQAQVFALESVLDVSYSDDKVVGRIQIDDTTYPVYTLSEELTPLNIIPEKRRICIILHTFITTADQPFFTKLAPQENPTQQAFNMFGLLCDQVILADWPNNIEILSLPECMRTFNTKITGLILQENAVLCFITAQNFLTCCNIQSNTE